MIIFYKKVQHLLVFASLLLLPASFLLLPELAFAQATQTIRGTVSDREAKFPLAGATVAIVDDPANPIGAATDAEGAFRLEGVKVGRHALKVSFLGYKDISMENIIVNSGKEIVLTLDLEESVVQQEAVVVSAQKTIRRHAQRNGNGVVTRLFD